MSSKIREKDQYANMYPKINKWLNECLICHSIGYKPEMPENIYPGRLAQNIRKQYPPLSVNEINVCEDCERHMNI
ncbi:MAG: hypothetical protein GW809_09090 [Bacteroidetes bacterium]|nr:hypothetical protein [Flavobacteriia bacterium]NCP07268.1 hypothetical protein [Flavobacteriales bacterium]NCQ12275.1 hypothetical protein [Bacteroidota bacterium]